MNIITNNMAENVKPDLALRKSGRVAKRSLCQSEVVKRGVKHDQDGTSVMGRLVSQEMLRAKREYSEAPVSADRLQQAGSDQFDPPSDAALDVIFSRMAGFSAVG